MAFLRSLVVVNLVLAWGFAERAAAADAFDPTPFVKKHCIRCHGQDKQNGDRRFDSLVGDFTSADK